MECPGWWGRRCPEIATAISWIDPDVVFISEFRAAGRGNLSGCLNELGYAHQIGGQDPGGGHTGLLVASRTELELGAITFASADDAHRFLHVRTKGWDLIGAYIPGSGVTGDRKQLYWRFLVDVVAFELRKSNALIIGDLNTGLHYRDEKGATFICDDIMAELFANGWRDAWIERNRRSRPPGTWLSPGSHSPFRLDHAILSPAAPSARDVNYPESINNRPVLGSGNLSDHLPVVVDLRPVRANQPERS